MTAVVAAGLIQSAHAFYYGFSTLAWKRQGIGEDVTGLLWAAGVAAEIVFMWGMEPWRRRIGPRNLLALGGVAAVARWTALALSPPLWALFPLQTLHALSYAATFLASLQLVERLSTPRNASAAQAINSALSGGVLSRAGHHRLGLAVRPRGSARLPADVGHVRGWAGGRRAALWRAAAGPCLTSGQPCVGPRGGHDRGDWRPPCAH